MLETFFATVLPQCAHVPVPEATEQAMRYFNSGNVLWIIDQFWSFFVPILFLIGGFSSRIEGVSQKWGKKWFFVIAIYLVLFTIFFKIMYIPLDYYAGFIRQHDFGLSNQTMAMWFANYGKQILVTIVGAIAFVWIFYLLLKKSPKRWWLYSSFVSVGVLFILGVVQPLWIDPLFNHFGPMKNKQLEQQILELASKAGIEHGRVFEIDKSKETNALNAYVTGFGSANRIVLWDTTIAQLTTDEILFVMGHEMGHYVLHHLWWELLYTSLIALAVFYLTYRSANYIMRRFGTQMGFSHLHHIASLPLLILLLNVYMLAFTPLTNYLSRQIEHNADRFGLEITQNNKAAGEAFIALQQKNLGNPRPGVIYKFWRCTHPPIGERIDFCNSYCPWKRDEPLKYAKYFKNEKGDTE